MTGLSPKRDCIPKGVNNTLSPACCFRCSSDCDRCSPLAVSLLPYLCSSYRRPSLSPLPLLLCCCYCCAGTAAAYASKYQVPGIYYIRLLAVLLLCPPNQVSPHPGTTTACFCNFSFRSAETPDYVTTSRHSSAIRVLVCIQNAECAGSTYLSTRFGSIQSSKCAALEYPSLNRSHSPMSIINNNTWYTYTCTGEHRIAEQI